MSRWGLRQYGISDAAVIMAAAFALSAVLGMLRQVLILVMGARQPPITPRLVYPKPSSTLWQVVP